MSLMSDVQPSDSSKASLRQMAYCFVLEFWDAGNMT